MAHYWFNILGQLHGQPVVHGSPTLQPRTETTTDGPGSHETRPFGLRFAWTFPRPTLRPAVRYCHQLQVSVDDDGRPLIERWDEEDDLAKKWISKDTTDGDEGPEESVWEWEE